MKSLWKRLVLWIARREIAELRMRLATKGLQLSATQAALELLKASYAMADLQNSMVRAVEMITAAEKQPPESKPGSKKVLH